MVVGELYMWNCKNPRNSSLFKDGITYYFLVDEIVNGDCFCLVHPIIGDGRDRIDIDRGSRIEAEWVRTLNGPEEFRARAL